ncbi:MAG: hypothetical protein AB8B53_10215, partial [Flavobacteriales bacterium]
MVADINISELLDSSKLISREQKAQLSLLKDEFPWSEIIQVLYLKSLKDTSDLRFSDELKRVALISHDRAKLYHFLYGAEIQETINKVEAEMDALPEVEGLVSPDWQKEETSVPSSENEEITSAEVPELKLVPELGLKSVSELENESEKVLSESTSESQHITDLEHPEESEEEIGKEQSESNSIDKNNNKHDSSSELEHHAPANETAEPDAKPSELNRLIISEAVDKVIVKEVIEDIEEKRNISSESETPKPSLDVVEHTSSNDFINWLINNAKSVNYPSFDAHTKAPKPVNVEQIIDKFIQTDPQIKRGKAKEYEKGNLAADSLVDREEFVTETLAEIYVSQGNISKAKRAFQLLSLKYPEKSIYFAARIKRLGQK